MTAIFIAKQKKIKKQINKLSAENLHTSDNYLNPFF